MVQTYQEGDSFLHRLNPTMKLAGLFLLTMVPTFFLDPAVPATFLALAVVMGWALGGISPLTLARRLTLILLMALGLALSSTIFYGGEKTQLLFSVGPVDIYAEAVLFGLSLGLRILCVVAFGALFMITTDPTRLVYSLVQQAHLNYRLGYTILAAYRFIPILQSEMNNIRDAHSVRGAYTARSPSAALERARRYGVPLLANAIRQAERLAVAMDARGFSARPNRTYYLTLRLQLTDWLFGIGVVLITIALLLLLAHFGLLRGFFVALSDKLFQSGAGQ